MIVTGVEKTPFLLAYYNSCQMLLRGGMFSNVWSDVISTFNDDMPCANVDPYSLIFHSVECKSFMTRKASKNVLGDVNVSLNS